MKESKLFLLTVSLLGACSLLISCGGETVSTLEEEGKSDIVESSSEEIPLSTFVYSNYEHVNVIADIDAYYADTQGERQYLADENGIIVSPYHTLRVNDIDVPVYSTRVEHGLHSFCYLLVNEDKVNLHVEITTFQDMEKTVVLPLTTGIIANTEGSKITANLNDFGTFSFAFNDTNTWGLTFIIAKNEEFKCPDGYTKIEYDCADFSATTSDGGSINLNSENTAYYFKKGHYYIHDIKLGSNVDVYFEPGTYIESYIYYDGNGNSSDTSTFMTSNGTSNIRIYGNALVDFAGHIGGGPTPVYKKEYVFQTVSDFEFKGVISIDSVSWTLCITDGINLEVDWNLFLSYKQCSDGIMLSDCQDSIVHHNFCRVGDDAIEAKSTGTQGSKNLVYEYNAVWADKARCYGCIYEAKHDMENIVFRHNSVGFSVPHWANYGCLLITVGENTEVSWHDIHFEDTEIYYTTNKVLAVYSSARTGGASIRNIYFKDTTVYCSLDTHGELVYIDIAEDTMVGKFYVENLTYKNAEGNMVKYTTEDKENETLTHVNVWYHYSLNNLVVS